MTANSGRFWIPREMRLMVPSGDSIYFLEGDAVGHRARRDEGSGLRNAGAVSPGLRGAPRRADRMAGPTCTQACVNRTHGFLEDDWERRNFDFR